MVKFGKTITVKVSFKSTHWAGAKFGTQHAAPNLELRNDSENWIDKLTSMHKCSIHSMGPLKNNEHLQIPTSNPDK